ncbi:hypothetical protein [Aneurinibacillus uraniidurans]|nr:hypothetical protein [Aneurinibacillus sp. B1]WCN38661.1 hypothetical protein PO771_04465 [Aneurinibacillus sp. B1]
MTKKKKNKIEIRSISYSLDPDSNMKWFDIWVKLAKKELLHECSKLERKD